MREGRRLIWGRALLPLLLLCLTLVGCGNSDVQEFLAPGNTLASIRVVPGDQVLPLGLDQQYRVEALFSNGGVVDVTDQATWTSSDPAVASIDAAGLAQTLSTGQTTVTATSSGLSASATLTVSAAQLIDLQLTTTTPSIAVDTLADLTATGTLSDGAVVDLTASASYSSSNTSVASISNPGAALGLAAGTTTITATVGGLSDSLPLQVTGAAITSIAVSTVDAAANNSVDVGDVLPLQAIATRSDASTQDVTTTVTWTSSDTALATVSNATSDKGVVAGLSAGSVTISASLTSGGVPVTGTLGVQVIARPSLVLDTVNYSFDTDTGLLTPQGGQPATITGWDPVQHQVRLSSFQLDTSMSVTGSTPFRLRSVGKVVINGGLTTAGGAGAGPLGGGGDGLPLELSTHSDLDLFGLVTSSGGLGSGGNPGGGKGGNAGPIRLLCDGDFTLRGVVAADGGDGGAGCFAGGNGGNAANVTLVVGGSYYHSGVLVCAAGSGGGNNTTGGGNGGASNSVDCQIGGPVSLIGVVDVSGGSGGTNSGSGGNGSGGGIFNLTAQGDITVIGVIITRGGDPAGGSTDGGGNAGSGGALTITTTQRLHHFGVMDVSGGSGQNGNTNTTGDGGGNGGDGGTMALTALKGLDLVNASVLFATGGDGGDNNTAPGFNGGGNGGDGGHITLDGGGSVNQSGLTSVAFGAGGTGNGAGGGANGAAGTVDVVAP